MKNPYETPQSELVDEVNTLRKKTGWKVFFWIFMPFACLSFWSVISDSGASLIDQSGEIIIYTLIGIGIFGFAYNKQIIAVRFWQYFIPCAMLWDMYTLIKQDWSIFSESEIAVWIFIIFTLLCLGILLFLQYFALYQYAFRSHEIWIKNK